jgi:hypothetical protein
MANQSDSRPSKSAPRARDITAGNGDQLDSARQAILDLLHTAAIKPKQTADKCWKLLKSFRVSFTRPKIGSRS